MPARDEILALYQAGPEAIVALVGRRAHEAWGLLNLLGWYALCNAHLLRELIGVHEETGQAWAQKLIR
jgi:hypothetical protein